MQKKEDSFSEQIYGLSFRFMDDPWLNRKYHVDSTQQIFWTLNDPIMKFHTDEFKWPSFGFSRNFESEFQIISEFWKLEIFNWQ